EFWCTVVVEHPTPPAKESESLPFRESNIKFTVKIGKTSLLLNYQTFFQSTSREYNTRNYVAHPSTEEVKVELAKIATHDVLVYKTPFLKAIFHAAWRILMTFVIQSLPEGTITDPKDSGRTIQLTNRGLPFTNGFNQSGSDINFGDYQVLLEDSEDHLMDLNDEEMYEAGEEIDDEQTHTQEEHQPTEHHSLKPLKEKVSEILKVYSALKATMQTMAETNTTTYANITSLTKLIRNAKLPEIMTQINIFQTSINSLSSQCSSILESITKDLEFNQRITNTKNTQVTMQSNIASIKTNTSTMKEMVTGMFNAFKGLYSSTPQEVRSCQQSPSEDTITVVGKGGEF
nr:hypothetical protein [Tanacetum cinerariifolium]